MANEIYCLGSVGPASAQAGRTLAQAFQNAPDYSWMLSGHSDKVAALSWFFGQFVSNLAVRYGRLYVSRDCDAAILTFAPGQVPSAMAVLRAGVLQFPFRFGWKSTWRAMTLGTHMEKRRLQLAPMPHWYVIAVGVTPASQGRGLGRDLVSHIIKRAEVDGVPCYLEAFEDDLVAHYQRRGFVIVKQEFLPSGLHLRYLLRPVSTVSVPATPAMNAREPA
jgi:ribosomal protein S18 acetylase RimI-like enzyme